MAALAVLRWKALTVCCEGLVNMETWRMMLLLR
jgi:hypothetical protein